MATTEPATPRKVSARTRAGALPRFRGNVPCNCVRHLRRVGWPRLTCGRDWNKSPYAQVKAKREVLTSLMRLEQPSYLR
jgi:hypothetical protein